MEMKKASIKYMLIASTLLMAAILVLSANVSAQVPGQQLNVPLTQSPRTLGQPQAGFSGGVTGTAVNPIGAGGIGIGSQTGTGSQWPSTYSRTDYQYPAGQGPLTQPASNTGPTCYCIRAPCNCPGQGQLPQQIPNDFPQNLPTGGGGIGQSAGQAIALQNLQNPQTTRTDIPNI